MTTGDALRHTPSCVCVRVWCSVFCRRRFFVRSLSFSSVVSIFFCSIYFIFIFIWCMNNVQFVHLYITCRQCKHENIYIIGHWLWNRCLSPVWHSALCVLHDGMDDRVRCHCANCVIIRSMQWPRQLRAQQVNITGNEIIRCFLEVFFGFFLIILSSPLFNLINKNGLSPLFVFLFYLSLLRLLLLPLTLARCTGKLRTGTETLSANSINLHFPIF